MEVLLQTIDSFSGEYLRETQEIADFTGEGVRDAFNRELIELGVPVAGLFTLIDWELTTSQDSAAFILRSVCPSNHYMVGIVYKNSRMPKFQK